MILAQIKGFPHWKSLKKGDIETNCDYDRDQFQDYLKTDEKKDQKMK